MFDPRATDGHFYQGVHREGRMVEGVSVDWIWWFSKVVVTVHNVPTRHWKGRSTKNQNQIGQK